jgi:hypothetical protein
MSKEASVETLTTSPTPHISLNNTRIVATRRGDGLDSGKPCIFRPVRQWLALHWWLDDKEEPANGVWN